MVFRLIYISNSCVVFYVIVRNMALVYDVTEFFWKFQISD